MSNVLIVGDNDELNTIIESALKNNSITASIALTEDDVLKKLEDENVSMIILDAGIKSFDAAILSRKLKSYTHLENILVLAVIGPDIDNPDILRTTNAYITKPVNEKILLATVNSNLKLKKNNLKLFDSLPSVQRGTLETDLDEVFAQ